MSGPLRGSALLAVVLSISACGGGGGGGSTPSAASPPPQRGVIAFAGDQSAYPESQGTVNLALTRSAGSQGEISATVTIAGTATREQDFTTTATVTFASGVTTATLPIVLINDGEAELDETLTLTLASVAGGAALGTTTNHTLTIQNDDPPLPPVATITANVKQLVFSWSPIVTATSYRLLVSPNGLDPFVPAMQDIAAGTEAVLPIAVHQLDWTSVRYRVAACNAVGCTQSASLSTTNAQMLASIGAPMSTNYDPNDQLGHASAFNADGSIMVIGAPAESSNASGINGDQDNDAAPASGAVYVFERQSNGLWIQQAYLKASNTRITPSGGAYFGSAVGISDDGATIVVGAYGEHSSSTGVNGNQTPVSAPLAGAAYVFNRSAAGQWAQSAYIKASNTDPLDLFGASVSVSGDGRTIAVGAPAEDGSAVLVNGADDNSTPDQGAVYVFSLIGDGWEQIAYLKPHLRISATAEMQFGRKVSLDHSGNTIAIGTNLYGVYIYSKSTGDWEYDTVVQAGLRGLATNVAISRDGLTLAASQSHEGPLGAAASAAGAVYVFSNFATSGWTRTATLQDVNGSGTHGFGLGLAIGAGGKCIVAGAYHENSAAVGINGNPFDNSAPLSGAAFYFVLSDSNEWIHKAYVKAPIQGTQFAFGHHLATNSDCSALLISSGTRPFLY